MTDPSLPDLAEMEQGKQESPTGNLKEQIQARLGQQLHAARERKEITITEASLKLRLRETYLRELESGDWSNLPEEVYVLAFLRQYAALLGEDIHEDIEVLKSGGYQLTKPFTMPDPPIAPNKMWAMAAGILFVLLFILFNIVGNDGKETPLPETPATNASPLPTEKIATKQTTSKEMVKKDITPVAQPSAAQPSAAQPSVALSNSGNPSTNTNIEALSQMDKEAKASSPAALPEKAFKTHRYRLTAIGASVWLQVHNPSGTLLNEALLHPGQSLRLKSSASFLSVTCGNAAALQIEVDGTLYAAAGTLGAPGKVLHDFRIEVQTRTIHESP